MKTRKPINPSVLAEARKPVVKDPAAESNAVAWERAIAENGNNFPVVNRQAAETKSSVQGVVRTDELPAMDTTEPVAESPGKGRPSAKRPYERA